MRDHQEMDNIDQDFNELIALMSNISTTKQHSSATKQHSSTTKQHINNIKAKFNQDQLDAKCAKDGYALFRTFIHLNTILNTKKAFCALFSDKELCDALRANQSELLLDIVTSNNLELINILLPKFTPAEQRISLITANNNLLLVECMSQSSEGMFETLWNEIPLNKQEEIIQSPDFALVKATLSKTSKSLSKTSKSLNDIFSKFYSKLPIDELFKSNSELLVFAANHRHSHYSIKILKTYTLQQKNNALLANQGALLLAIAKHTKIQKDVKYFKGVLNALIDNPWGQNWLQGMAPDKSNNLLESFIINKQDDLFEKLLQLLSNNGPQAFYVTITANEKALLNVATQSSDPRFIKLICNNLKGLGKFQEVMSSDNYKNLAMLIVCNHEELALELYQQLNPEVRISVLNNTIHALITLDIIIGDGKLISQLLKQLSDEEQISLIKLNTYSIVTLLRNYTLTKNSDLHKKILNIIEKYCAETEGFVSEMLHSLLSREDATIHDIEHYFKFLNHAEIFYILSPNNYVVVSTYNPKLDSGFTFLNRIISIVEEYGQLKDIVTSNGYDLLNKLVASASDRCKDLAPRTFLGTTEHSILNRLSSSPDYLIISKLLNSLDNGELLDFILRENFKILDSIITISLNQNDHIEFLFGRFINVLGGDTLFELLIKKDNNLTFLNIMQIDDNQLFDRLWSRLSENEKKTEIAKNNYALITYASKTGKTEFIDTCCNNKYIGQSSIYPQIQYHNRLNDKTTPLYLAIENGHVEIFRRFATIVSYQMVQSLISKQNHHLLIINVQQNNKDMVDEIWKYISPLTQEKLLGVTTKNFSLINAAFCNQDKQVADKFWALLTSEAKSFHANVAINTKNLIKAKNHKMLDNLWNFQNFQQRRQIAAALIYFLNDDLSYAELANSVSWLYCVTCIMPQTQKGELIKQLSISETPAACAFIEIARSTKVMPDGTLEKRDTPPLFKTNSTLEKELKPIYQDLLSQLLSENEKKAEKIAINEIMSNAQYAIARVIDHIIEIKQLIKECYLLDKSKASDTDVIRLFEYLTSFLNNSNLSKSIDLSKDISIILTSSLFDMERLFETQVTQEQIKEIIKEREASVDVANALVALSEEGNATQHIPDADAANNFITALIAASEARDQNGYEEYKEGIDRPLITSSPSQIPPRDNNFQGNLDTSPQVESEKDSPTSFQSNSRKRTIANISSPEPTNLGL